MSGTTATLDHSAAAAADDDEVDARLNSDGDEIMAPAQHTITVEINGATGIDWTLANTLLLWRTPVTSSKQPAAPITAKHPPVITMSRSLDEPVTSTCTPDSRGNLSIAGQCEVHLPSRQLSAQTLLEQKGKTFMAYVHYAMNSYSNVITYDNVNGTASWRQETDGMAAWLLADDRPGPSAPLDPPAGQQDATAAAAVPARPHQQRRRWWQNPQLDGAPTSGDSFPTNLAEHRRGRRAVTQNMQSYKWLLSGGIAEGAQFEFSNNFTLLIPTIYRPLLKKSAASSQQQSEPAIKKCAKEAVTTGRQRHYQQAIMVAVYDPARPQCPDLNYATHTASLNSTVRSRVSDVCGPAVGPEDPCQSWEATTVYCSSKLLSNNRQLNDEC